MEHERKRFHHELVLKKQTGPSDDLVSSMEMLSRVCYLQGKISKEATIWLVIRARFNNRNQPPLQCNDRS